MTGFRKFLVPLMASAAFAFAAPANAAVAFFDFTEGGPAAGLGAGPYASVSVNDAGGVLAFSMTLAPGYLIHAGNANHQAFTFKILGDPNVAIGGLGAGFAAVSLTNADDVSSPPFGTYFTGISCGSPACGPGFGGGNAGPLNFTVSSAGALTLASLGFNTVDGKNIYFTTDVVQANGLTGNVGAVLSTTPAVPEPSTWALMLLGFGMIGFGMRRRSVTTSVSFA